MTILKELKEFAAKLSGVEPADVDARTIAKAIRWMTDHLPDLSTGGQLTETDPTVPAWAKQKEKPTYAAAEVGALPADTFIPSGAQLLTGDVAAPVATLAEDAELTAVVQTVNTVLGALKTRGITS